MKFGRFCTALACFLCFSSIICASLAAQDTIDYYRLAQEGTATEIRTAFKNRPTLKDQVFGSNRETFLMLALKADRDLDIINILLKAECSATARSHDGRTPIMYAARYSTHTNVLERLIKSGTLFGIGTKSRVSLMDSSGKTAFDYAAQNSTPGIIDVLQKYNPDVTPSPRIAETSSEEPPVEQRSEEKSAEKQPQTKEPEPLQEAYPAEMAQADIPQAAESTGQHVPESSRATEPPLAEQHEQNEENVPRVSAKGEEKSAPPTPNAPEEKAEVTEQKIVSVAKVPEVQEVPIPPAKPVILTPPRAREETQEAVSQASPAKTGEPERSAQTLPESILGQNQQGKQTEIRSYTQTYLYDFAKEDVVPAVSAQDALAADEGVIEYVNDADENGVTALMRAAKAGNDWDVQKLLASGADVQKRDADGWTALMYAVRYQNNAALVSLLIEHGALLRVRSKYNSTPLLLAAEYSQNPDILRRLLQNRSASEDEVYKAFVLAITGSESPDHIKEAKIKLFLDMEIPLNRVWKGKTPLMYASSYCNSTGILDLLIQNGARVATKDANGKTAFDYAKENVHLAHDSIYWSLNEPSKGSVQ